MGGTCPSHVAFPAAPSGALFPWPGPEREENLKVLSLLRAARGEAEHSGRCQRSHVRQATRYGRATPGHLALQRSTTQRVPALLRNAMCSARHAEQRQTGPPRTFPGPTLAVRSPAQAYFQRLSLLKLFRPSPGRDSRSCRHFPRFPAFRARIPPTRAFNLACLPQFLGVD